MNGIYWLVSYPKSGNTWLRAFLTNYLGDSGKPADINHLQAGQHVTSRDLFDEWTGIDSTDLTWEEIEHYRPLMYEQMAADIKFDGPFFTKIHDAYTYNGDRRPIFPKKATAGVIYIIRNPLDVAASYAHHENKGVDEIIELMASDTHAMLSNKEILYDHLPMKLLSWSSHVNSWTGISGELDIHVVRYEDMAAKPEAAFAGVIDFSGMDVDRQKVRNAIEFTRFERMQAQEKEKGFIEKQPTAKSFFRKGRAGSWRKELTKSQVRCIKASHGNVMRRYGYL